MTAAFALALLLRQNPTVPPVLPAGTSPEFAQLALSVEAKLVEGDVAAAREAAKALPVRQPSFAWADESTLTPGLRDGREGILTLAARVWGKAAKGFAPKLTEGQSDVTVGFAETLPDGPDGLPLATKVVLGPPFRATVGLRRGKPGEPIRSIDLNVEVLYAMGRYLGVPEARLPGTAMFRDARPGLIPLMPQGSELLVAAQNLRVADRLREGVAAGKPTGLVAATIKMARESMDLGEVRQGEPIRQYLEIENVGAGPLEFKLQPDCSCFTEVPAGHVAPQGRTSIPVFVNTIASMGRQDKRLVLLTNDPVRPQIEIPVTFKSRPAYRLFRPGGESVVVPDAGGAYDVFLYSDKNLPLNPVSWRWDGVDGKVVKAEPWSGKLADPELQEGPILRKGWRFRVQIAPKIATGQLPGTLTVETDSSVPMFRTLEYSMTMQRGIVASPSPLSLGDIVAGTRASLIVTRPNAPFRILGVDAGPLKAKWRDRNGGWEYQIDLEYPGGAPRGDLLTVVKVRTDDPKQPVVESLVSGNVR